VKVTLKKLYNGYNGVSTNKKARARGTLAGLLPQRINHALNTNALNLFTPHPPLPLKRGG
jgi:hypothetical protein